MKNTNEMEVIFDSLSANERFARVAVAAFLTQLNPTVEEVADVKTAVSEAVTNAIIHGYGEDGGCDVKGKVLPKVSVCCRIEETNFIVIVKDTGRGIADVEQAMMPMFTTKPEEDRSGMGFSFMEAFMDKVEVASAPGEGTCVRMEKAIGKGRNLWTTQSL